MGSETKAVILVVDDQLAIRLLSKRILEGSGYAVIMAEDGAMALKLLAEQPIDLIVADIAMPNLNGYQLFERVSENPNWVNVPFIFLSARDLDSDIRYAKSLGVDDYITKPFEPDDMLSSVRGRLLRAEQLSTYVDTPPINTPLPLHNESEACVQEPALFIDTKRHIVRAFGYEITLSAREFRLLLALHDNHDRVVPAEELIGVTHSLNTTRKEASSLLRPMVRSLRRKLGYRVGEKGCIRNVRGLGYQYIEYGNSFSHKVGQQLPQINQR